MNEAEKYIHFLKQKMGTIQYHQSEEKNKRWKELIKRIKKREIKKERGNMETKSRFEVIADLEQRKRELIQQKANINNEIKTKEKTIKELKRELEDEEEELKELKSTTKEKEETFDKLIESTEGALKNIIELQKKEKTS